MGNAMYDFKLSGGYQTWNDNFPPTPVATEDYPYQAISYRNYLGAVFTWELIASTTPLYDYFEIGPGTFLIKPTNSGQAVSFYANDDGSGTVIPGAWISTGESVLTYGVVTQCNYAVTGDYPLAATIAQIYGHNAIPTPFRVRNLRHFDAEFLQARAIKVKNTDGSWGRCNI